MKSHLTSSSTAEITGHPDAPEGTTAALVHPLGVGDGAGRTQAVHAHPRLALARPAAWTHKLILTGRLDYHTAAELEEEIECLCEEGVTSLTLDLRQLDAIDSVGAQTIALLGTACKTRGLHFTAVPGSPIVPGGAPVAGAESLHVDDPDETGVLHLARGYNAPPRDTSTAMVKNL